MIFGENGVERIDLNKAKLLLTSGEVTEAKTITDLSEEIKQGMHITFSPENMETLNKLFKDGFDVEVEIKLAATRKI